METGPPSLGNQGDSWQSHPGPELGRGAVGLQQELKESFERFQSYSMTEVTKHNESRISRKIVFSKDAPTIWLVYPTFRRLGTPRSLRERRSRWV